MSDNINETFFTIQCWFSTSGLEKHASWHNIDMGYFVDKRYELSREWTTKTSDLRSKTGYRGTADFSYCFDLLREIEKMNPDKKFRIARIDYSCIITPIETSLNERHT